MGDVSVATRGLLRRGRDGQEVFFPYGALGAGYVVPSPEHALRIRRFVRRWQLVAFPVAVLVGLVLGQLWPFLDGVEVGVLVAIGLVPVMAYVARVWRLTENLSRSPDRFPLAEGLRGGAAAYGRGLLWALELGSLLLVAGAVWVLLIRPDRWLLGVLGVGVFGLCAVVFAWMIRLAGEARRS